MNEESGEDLRRRLNRETARIGWDELAPHFARGALVRVNPGLDLVEVAATFVEDRREAVEGWMTSGEIGIADDADGRRWTEEKTEFWAVVVAPWVLVQPAEKSAG